MIISAMPAINVEKKKSVKEFVIYGSKYNPKGM